MPTPPWFEPVRGGATPTGKDKERLAEADGEDGASARKGRKKP